MKVGIAGGIGSGKSFVAKLLAERGIPVYDCDAAAKRLMHASPLLRQQLTALIGPDCYILSSPSTLHPSPPVPRLNKAAATRFLLASEDNASALQAIVHPAVFTDFEQSGMLWMESAIMFESGANRHVDRVVVVTAPDEIRLQRVMSRDNISRQQALQWMARQWPQQRVRQLAHYEIVNDGCADLGPQIDRLLAALGTIK